MRLAGWIERRYADFAAQRNLRDRLRDWSRVLRPGLDLCVLPPAAMALGVIIYFQSPVALGGLASAGVAGLCVLGRALARRYLAHMRIAHILAVAMWAGVGWSASAIRVDMAATPVMPEQLRTYEVTGWVSRVDPGARPGVVVEVAAISGLERPDWPKRVRARISGEAPSLGRGVNGVMTLSAPPGPSMFGAYDFSRRAWFDQIGGVGFSYSGLQPANVDVSGIADIRRSIALFRGQVADRIRATGPGGTRAIIAALVTGDRSAIEPADAEALRASGLGHLLAISGLHMALMGGGAFFVIAMALAAIEPYARSFDVRKPAAIAALAASAVYLVISGAPISAQRAFIMLGIAFLAILAERRALTLRNVAVAAVIVLALSPEALMEAGFQMSFAAAAALVAAFDFQRQRMQYRPWPGPVRFFAGLSMTSLVAGAATAAFAAFHFNRWAAYGLFANLAAMPVFSTLVMPFAALGLVVMPLGWEGGPIWVANWGMNRVLDVAQTAADAPGALANPAAGPGFALALYAAGFATLIAGRGVVRIAGAVVVAGSAIIWATTPKPIAWVSENGVVAIVESGQIMTSDRRRENYAMNQLARRLGLNETNNLLRLQDRLLCDIDACRGVIAGVAISHVQNRRALSEECRNSDLIVFADQVSARQKRLCKAMLIDHEVLTRSEAISVYKTPGGIRLKSAAESRWRPPGDD